MRCSFADSFLRPLVEEGNTCARVPARMLPRFQSAETASHGHSSRQTCPGELHPKCMTPTVCCFSRRCNTTLPEVTVASVVQSSGIRILSTSRLMLLILYCPLGVLTFGDMPYMAPEHRKAHADPRMSHLSRYRRGSECCIHSMIYRAPSGPSEGTP